MLGASYRVLVQVDGRSAGVSRWLARQLCDTGPCTSHIMPFTITFIGFGNGRHL